MLPLLSTVILLVSLPFHTLGQSITGIEAKKDTIVYNFLFIQPKYQNKFAFLGRDYGLGTSLASVNVLYYSHSNIWFGISGFTFDDPDIPELLAASIGMYYEFSEKSDMHLSYSQYYIPDRTIPESSKTQGYIQTTLGLDWGMLYSTLQFHALLNRQSDFLISTYHSRYFQFNDKLWKKILVSFEPKFSVTFGTNHFDYVNEGVIIGPGGGGVTPSGQSEGSGGSIKLLNWDFVFPLKFEVGRFSLEVYWKYTSPINISDTDPSKPLHLVGAGVEYYFQIKRHKNLK